MFRGLIRTSGSLTLTLMRLVLGVLFFAHGAQKALGWYGGNGFDATVRFFGQNLHIPQVLAVAAILAEFLGGILLVFGFLTRLAALGIAVNMVVAVMLVHFHNGLFMNWTGTQPGEGFEFHLLAFAMALTLVVRGAGALSIDRAIERSIGDRLDAVRLPRAA
jgi:putative oxidoreductase